MKNNRLIHLNPYSNIFPQDVKLPEANTIPTHPTFTQQGLQAKEK